MKRNIILLGLLLTLVSTTTNATAQLEGFWESVDNYGTTLEIEQSRNGIRVRSDNGGRWDFYRRKGKRSYQNRIGKTIAIQRNGNLVLKDDFYDRWPNVFRKISDRRYRNDQYDDNYYDGNYHNSNSYGSRINKQDFVGNWVSNQTNTQLGLSNATNGFSVRTNGTYRNSQFQEIEYGVFQNRRGDVIYIEGPDRIVWKSNDGRYRYTFYRDQYRDNPRRGNGRNTCPSGWN